MFNQPLPEFLVGPVGLQKRTFGDYRSIISNGPDAISVAEPAVSKHCLVAGHVVQLQQPVCSVILTYLFSSYPPFMALNGL